MVAGKCFFGAHHEDYSGFVRERDALRFNKRRGVSKSLNNGDTWKDLSESFSQYQNSNQIVDLIPSVATRDVISRQPLRPS